MDRGHMDRCGLSGCLTCSPGKGTRERVVRGQAVIRWYLGMSGQVIIQREVFTRVRWLAGWMSGVGSISA